MNKNFTTIFIYLSVHIKEFVGIFSFVVLLKTVLSRSSKQVINDR